MGSSPSVALLRSVPLGKEAGLVGDVKHRWGFVLRRAGGLRLKPSRCWALSRGMGKSSKVVKAGGLVSHEEVLQLLGKTPSIGTSEGGVIPPAVCTCFSAGNWESGRGGLLAHNNSAFNKGALSQSCFTENRPLMSKPRATVARKNSLADNRKKP